MKYELYGYIYDIDDCCETVYKKETKLKNKEQVKEEIEELKEKCNKNPQYGCEYNIVKKLF
nr:MAG TPA: hypothetical protein [Caudoviricetes sp.]